MENNVLKHRKAVMNNIAKSFGYEKSEDLLEKAEDNDIEKAKHQDGDMHPNGKWVWSASVNGGKGDWRVAKKGSSSTSGGSESAGDSGGTDLKPRVKSALAKEVGLETKKKPEKSSYESEIADAYDKGDGKLGNYPVPTHTSYPAANLYNRLNNNRHFGFKHGMPEKEIMKKLKDYKGNVNVSYHNNGGTFQIYRIKFL